MAERKNYSNTWPDFPARMGAPDPDFLFEDTTGMRLFAKLQAGNPQLNPFLDGKVLRSNHRYNPDQLMSLGASMFLDGAGNRGRSPQTDMDYKMVLATLETKGLKIPSYAHLSGERLHLLYTATRDYLTHRLVVKDDIASMRTGSHAEQAAY
jgi:hypothetical protein